MQYSYTLLIARILEKFGSRRNFSEHLGMSESTMLCKLRNESDWKQGEIQKACDLLEIPTVNIPDYFFAV